MSAKGLSNAGIVVATQHDYATRRLSVVAKRAVVTMAESGYHVLQLYGLSATGAELCACLLEAKVEKWRVRVGFLCAHGGRGYLRGHNGKRLLDQGSCGMFADAVLVVAACLKGGALAQTMASEKGRIRGCVGFREWLSVPMPRSWQKILGRVGGREWHEKFSMCLLEPLSVLLSGGNAGDATDAGRRAWHDCADSLLSRDWRIAYVFRRNGYNIDCWGKRSARL